ncbi:uncharacterized protein LOC144652156 [Oculina patagonica]
MAWKLRIMKITQGHETLFRRLLKKIFNLLGTDPWNRLTEFSHGSAGNPFSPCFAVTTDAFFQQTDVRKTACLSSIQKREYLAGSWLSFTPQSASSSEEFNIYISDL